MVIPANDTIEGRDVTKKDYNTAVYRLSYFLSFQQFGEWAFRDLKETWWIIGIELIGASLGAGLSSASADTNFTFPTSALNQMP